MSPYYEQDGVTIYHGDCREVLPNLGSESVDIVWTDPPYGHNNNNGDLIHRWEAALGQLPSGQAPPQARPVANDGPEEMRAVVDAALTECARILKRDCCCCCCCGGGGPRPTFAWLAERMDRGGLSFFHSVIWDKGGLGMGWRYRRNHEMVMIAHRRGGKLKWEWGGSGEETANVVRIGKIIPSADDHPTPKPPALVRHFLRLHGTAGDMVLDPFMGHGVLLVEAKRMGMRAIGIGVNERYCEIAARQLAQGALPMEMGAWSQPSFFDVPQAPQAVTVSPSAREARRSGLKRARAQEGQGARYLAALLRHGPASDVTMSELLGIPLASVCGRRNECGAAVEAAGRERVTFASGRATSRTLWRVKA